MNGYRVGGKQGLTEDEEKRTLWIGWGPPGPGPGRKPYHWTWDDENKRLVLAPGYTEYEQIRADIVQKMIDGGIPPQDITAEMIERVVSKAETAAMLNELERTAEDAPTEP